MYNAQVVIKQVEDWIKQKQFEIDMEDDKSEKFEIKCRIDHVERNLHYWIKGQLEKGLYFHFCKQCGEIEFAQYNNTLKERLTDNKLCFTCDLWNEREKEFTNGNKSKSIIVKGNMYTDGGSTKGNTQFNGFAGAVFKIRMLDGSKEWSTNNLWCGGQIPKRLRLTTMKDTAEFIK